MKKIFTPIVLLIFITVILTTSCKELFSQDYPDVSRFNDSANHWYNVFDEDRVIQPTPARKRYSPAEFVEIADNIILFQKNNGGWAKNYDMRAVLNDVQKDSLLNSKNRLNTTFDNGATHSQLSYLAEVFTLTNDQKYKIAFLKGLNFALKTQYNNGGWPQSFPDTSGYHKYITFNDGAMAGIMTILKDITYNDSNYSFVEKSLREKVSEAYNNGLNCILKCQIVENGEKLAWCQQHDNITLEPKDARTFEKASICNGESVGIVNFLMDIPHPSKAVVEAVTSAVEWFKQSEIHGIRIEWIDAEPEKFIYHSSSQDRLVIEDKDAPPIWARFYELKTHRPIFCGRDGIIKYSMAEIDRDRRTGYQWYSYRPETILERFSEWKNELVK